MGEIVFDYSKLRGKIAEVYVNRRAFADAIGMNRSTLCQKLNGKREFGQEEIVRMSRALGIEPGDISVYFFTVKS